MSEDNNTVVTLKVRVTPEFREKIIETAKANNRSMNAEIVHRLEESFPREYKQLIGRVNRYPEEQAERKRLAEIAAIQAISHLSARELIETLYHEINPEDHDQDGVDKNKKAP